MGKDKKKPRPERQAVKDRYPVAIILLIIIALYVVKNLSSAFSNHLETVAAVRVTVNDSFTGSAWFFRDELTVTSAYQGAIKHSVSSGERVQQDATLAMLYSTDDALALSRSMEPLDKKITMVESALQTAGDGSDAGKLDQQIISGLQQMAEEMKAGTGTKLASSVNTLRTLSLKREAGNLVPADLGAERDALVAERSALDTQLSGKATSITAPGSGYFSEVVDGYEAVLRPELLETLTLDQFHQLIEKKQETDTEMLGKVIQGFSWYLVVETTDENAARLEKGQSLRVYFTQASLESPVTVWSVIRERGAENALVVLEGSNFTSEMVSMRQQPVEVILGSYTGLKVPKSAVRVQTRTDENDAIIDEKTGVFILSGSVQKFKNITNRILYEGDDFYIVRQSATDVDALVVQDQIITRGKNLQNNMVVKT